MSNPLLLLGATICPFLGALILGFVPENRTKVRNVLAMLVTSLTAFIVMVLFARVFQGSVPVVRIGSLMPGIDIVLRLDPLGAIFAVLASILWVFATLYSIGYMDHEHNKRRYFLFYILSLGATLGIAFSANLITLYLFYEFLTLFTYPLVIHEGNKDAQKAGKRYIMYSFMGAGLILIGILLTLGASGSLDFIPGGIITVTPASLNYLQLIFFCFLFGFGVKAAMMPLHAWLPSAMAAPTPVSALLHAVAVVKSGVFGILRVMFMVFGPTALQGMHVGTFVLVMASITIIVASLFALKQDVLKKRLAYSTISQLSYIVLGAGLLSAMGLTGSILHLINHALIKITLFFCAGAIITMTGKKKISELNGVAKRMPWTMAAFAVGSIGMVGIMPINGFIAKLFLIKGSLEADVPAVIIILVTSAILNAAYFFPIVVTAFFHEGSFEKPKGLEAPVSLLLPIVVLAAVCIVLGLKPDLTIILVRTVVSQVFGL